MEIKPNDQSKEITVYLYMKKQSWQEEFHLFVSLTPPETASKYAGVYLNSKKIRVDLTSHENRVQLFLAHLANQENLIKAQAQEALNAIADHKLGYCN